MARAEAELARQLVSRARRQRRGRPTHAGRAGRGYSPRGGSPPDAELLVDRLRRRPRAARRFVAQGRRGRRRAEAERRLEELAPGVPPRHRRRVAARSQPGRGPRGSRGPERPARPGRRGEGGSARAAHRAACGGQAGLPRRPPLQEGAEGDEATRGRGDCTVRRCRRRQWHRGGGRHHAWPAAIVLGGVLVVLALAPCSNGGGGPPRPPSLRRNRGRGARLGDHLREHEDQFGDWGVRVMKSMAADDALRAALERWEAVAGHDVDPDQVEHLVAAVAALDQARDLAPAGRGRRGRCTAVWMTTASELGIATDPAPEPGPTLELAERALARALIAADLLRDLHDAEQRGRHACGSTDSCADERWPSWPTTRRSSPQRRATTRGARPPPLRRPRGLAPDGRIDLLQEAAVWAPRAVRRRHPRSQRMDVGRWPSPARRRPRSDPTRRCATSSCAPVRFEPITETRPWFAS